LPAPRLRVVARHAAGAVHLKKDQAAAGVQFG